MLYSSLRYDILFLSFFRLGGNLFTSLLLPFGKAVWGWLLTCFHRLSGQTHQ